MIKKITVSFFMSVLISGLFAQKIEVTGVKKIKVKGDKSLYHAKISPDKSKLIATSENYKGLCFIDIGSGDIQIISSNRRAGLNAGFINNGTDISFTEKSGGLFNKRVETFSYNIRSNRKVKASSSSLKSAENGVKILSGSTYSIDVSVNGAEKKLTPLGECHYIWKSLSPDNSKVLFTTPGKGSYICDINGKNLIRLGYLNKPSWLSDKIVIGMKDYDDGYSVKKSDIYAIATDTQKEFRLTQTDDEIEMNPSASEDGKCVVFNTRKGELFLMTLKIKEQ